MGTLWYNGTFFSMEAEGETFEAVYVEKGIVREAGDKQHLLDKYRNDINIRHDLNGLFVYPGFVDSHLHIVGHGEKLIRLDLSIAKSAEEMKRMLVEKETVLDVMDWLIGDGWNENNFIDRKIFHRDELDEICEDKPMFLTRVCRHAALVNSKALALAGITKETKDPEGES
nr:amidohydrolase family protein [Halalkalibacter krulwichiae]